MADDSWIKLYRKIQDWEIYFSEPFTKAQAWMDMLMIANHKEGHLFIRGNDIIIKRGQVGYSDVKLAARWKWSRKKVENFLNYLEKEQQIIQQKKCLLNIKTIVNYENYQEKRAAEWTTEEQQSGQQKSSRVDTNKNTKKNTLPIGSGEGSPAPPEELKTFGDPEVNRVMEIIEEKTGLPPVPGKQNRVHAKNMIKLFRKKYPDKDALEHFELLIDIGLKLNDKYHTPKLNDLAHIYYHWQEIATLYKQTLKTKSDKPKGTL